MKKLIDIPDGIVIDLKILAAKQNLDLKNWIEKELIKKVECEKQKETKLSKQKNKSNA